MTARGSILDAQIPGSANDLVEGFAQHLDAQVERDSGTKGTIVRLTYLSREAS
jgi:hypothetical protein